MPAARTTMPTPAENPDLVYKIAFLQNELFYSMPACRNYAGGCKYTSTPKHGIMKYLIVLLAFPFLSASECTKKDTIPSCVQTFIDKGIQNLPEAPQQIDEYLYNGKRVYLVTAPCCDQYNTVYDKDCTAICAPSGGITGKGDGRCPNFSTTATHVRVIWTKAK